MGAAEQTQGFRRWLNDNGLGIAHTVGAGVGASTLTVQHDSGMELVFFRGWANNHLIWSPVMVDFPKDVEALDAVMRYMDNVEFNGVTEFALEDAQHRRTPLAVPFPPKTKARKITPFSEQEHTVDWANYVSQPPWKPLPQAGPEDIDF